MKIYRLLPAIIRVSLSYTTYDNIFLLYIEITLFRVTTLMVSRNNKRVLRSRARSALVLLYGTTNTMEHHHFNHAVMILSSEVSFSLLPNERSDQQLHSIIKHLLRIIVYTFNVFQNLNIFSSLSAESFSTVMKVLKHSILATDLCMYFQ